jgi:multidrug resistance protein MdtO
MRDLWNKFWLGLPPAEFLRAELRWTPARRILTLRLFVILMVISLVSVTLRPPATVALSFAFVMILGASMTDYTMTLRTALQLVKLVLLAIGLSIVSLGLWGDQPWFLVPWSFTLITLLLFYARVSGTPTITAVLYVAVVLFNPEQPMQNVYGALWLFPTLVLLTYGSAVVAHLVLWRQDPLAVLHEHITARFDAIIRMLESLVEYGVDLEPRTDGRDRPHPGAVSRHFHLLSNAELAHPELKLKHLEWVDLIAEVDTWFNNTAALARLMARTDAVRRFSGSEFARLQANLAECRTLRADFLASRQPLTLSEPRATEHDRPNIDPDQPVAHFLHRLDDVALRIRKTLADVYSPASAVAIPAAAPRPAAASAFWRTYVQKEYWADNIDSLHYGMKYAMAVVISLFLVQALHWKEIATAILTCVIVAQTSLGASYRLSLLRILGAILGGLLAYVFIIVLQPALETIAGFLLAIAPVCWLAAWVGSGSPRIAYVGTQIGFSFANAILPGYGPVTNLDIAWDRVFGILIGITIVGIIDYALWPQRSEHLAMNRLAIALRMLSRFVTLDGAGTGSSRADADLMHAIDGELQKAAGLLEHAAMEPGAGRAFSLDLIIDAVHGVARVTQARHRYYLDQDFKLQAETLLEQQEVLNRACCELLLSLARKVQQQPATTTPACRTLLAELENSARQLTAARAIDWETRKSILACIDLNKILLDYVEELDRLVTTLNSPSDPGRDA